MIVSALAAALHLDPLLSVCHRLGARHLSLFGSAARRPPGEAADIDFHLVVPRMDREAYGALAVAAEETVRELAGRAGRPWRVELRHGPLKPAPGAGSELQLHLVADDDASLGLATGILRAHRSATGTLLFGGPLPDLGLERRSPETWRREAVAELLRWREALVERRILFRHWVFDPEPGLAAGWTPAATAWELRCLLRGAAIAADLHYLAAAPPVGPEAELSLLTGIAVEPWQDLPRRWDEVAGPLAERLDRRLDHLSRL